MIELDWGLDNDVPVYDNGGWLSRVIDWGMSWLGL